MDRLRSYLNDNPETWLIAKPADDEYGQGIFFFNKIEDYEAKCIRDEYVVQKYLNTPYLFRNRKFDMRVYALVNGVSHQKAYVYDLGFVHLCTEDFVADDFTDPQRHNANPVQNNMNENYVL